MMGGVSQETQQEIGRPLRENCRCVDRPDRSTFAGRGSLGAVAVERKDDLGATGHDANAIHGPGRITNTRSPTLKKHAPLAIWRLARLARHSSILVSRRQQLAVVVDAPGIHNLELASARLRLARLGIDCE